VNVNPVSLAVTRTLAGLSQAGLSRATGISQGYISGIEAGDKHATPEMLKKLADGIGVPIAALITDPTAAQIAEAKSRLSRKVPGTKVLIDRRKAS
jgi:transcriptional regulator with XRE-family HTH domain